METIVWQRESKKSIAGIRLRRLALGVQQQALAAAVERSPSWLALRESGDYATTPDEITMLNAALDQLERGVQ